MTTNPVGKIPRDRLQKDLSKYKQQAIDMGATDAKVITSEAVVIDERVVAKCAYPRCTGYGTNANCPPYTMSPDEMRKLVKKYHYGLFIKLEVPPGDITGTEAIEKNLVLPYKKKVNEIVAHIETRAFYDGHYLALGFGSGSCQSIFCADTECVALEPGKACTHPLQARASMEAVGIDCFAMATRVGWDIYPIGRETRPEEIPYGLRLGLVLIA
jgi:predicted metal-binding protein